MLNIALEKVGTSIMFLTLLINYDGLRLVIINELVQFFRQIDGGHKCIFPIH